MATKLVFILDRSGSMLGKESDVIGGFNSFIKSQKELKDKTTVTTILFDDQYEILHDNVKLQAVEPITSKEYFVRGVTALLDAVGKTVNHIDHRARKNDKVLFVITTDGRENASKEFSKEKVKEMVKHFEEAHDWKFIFLGANIDSFAEGGSMGIGNNFNYQNSSYGISTMYAAVSDTATTWRATRGETLDVKGLKHLNDKDSNSNTP